MPGHGQHGPRGHQDTRKLSLFADSGKPEFYDAGVPVPAVARRTETSGKPPGISIIDLRGRNITQNAVALRVRAERKLKELLKLLCGLDFPVNRKTQPACFSALHTPYLIPQYNTRRKEWPQLNSTSQPTYESDDDGRSEFKREQFGSTGEGC
jgi:hypothetical protein